MKYLLQTRIVFGVNSIIPKEEYEAELKLHFERYPELDFHGYKTSFPFWSSEPFTYASSQYRSLVTSGQLQ